MGGSKTTTQTQARATPTAEETAFNKIQLEIAESAKEGQIAANQNALNLVNQLLTGGKFPGFLESLPGGITPEEEAIQATEFAKAANPRFQQAGLFDSGTAFQQTAEGIAKEVTVPVKQFNLQNIMQLLNQGLGGQASVQQPILGSGQVLASNLQGLRNITQTSTVTSPNPFLTSLQTSAGQSLGTFGGSIGGTKGKISFGQT